MSCSNSWRGETTGSGKLNPLGIPGDQGSPWDATDQGWPPFWRDWCSHCSSAQPSGTAAVRAAPGGIAALVFGDRGVAVPVVNFDLTIAPKVLVKDVAVAVVLPPRAKLPVPGAVEHVEELWVLHPHHGEEILVPEVALEAVLLGELLHHGGLQQLVVELGAPHGLQVEEQDAAVEARQPVGRGLPHPGFGVLAAVLPEGVPGERAEARTGGERAQRAATSTQGRPGNENWMQPVNRGPLRMQKTETLC